MNTKILKRSIVAGVLAVFSVISWLEFSSPPLYGAENVMTDDVKG